MQISASKQRYRRIIAYLPAAISLSLSEGPFVQRCVLYLRNSAAFARLVARRGIRVPGQSATQKSAHESVRQDYVTWSSTPGVLKRDSFSWSSENRERSQIARTIFYGGSIFLAKCPLLRDVEWDYVA